MEKSKSGSQDSMMPVASKLSTGSSSTPSWKTSTSSL